MHRGLAQFGSEVYDTIYLYMVSYTLDPKQAKPLWYSAQILLHTGNEMIMWNILSSLNANDVFPVNLSIR